MVRLRVRDANTSCFAENDAVRCDLVLRWYGDAAGNDPAAAGARR
jgi:hypothetical protein